MTSGYFSGDKKYKMAFYILLGILAGTALFILFGFAVQFLWNQTIADMFGLTAISFWQALGVFILAKLLFGFGISGSGSNSGGKTRQRRKDGDDEPPSRNNDEFRRFWRDTGREAFEEYRARREGNGTSPSGSDPEAPQ